MANGFMQRSIPRTAIDFNVVSKDEALRLYESWGSSGGKWQKFAEEFLSSKAVALVVKNIKSQNLGKMDKKFPNIYFFEREGVVYIVNTDKIPEFADIKANKIKIRQKRSNE